MGTDRLLLGISDVVNVDSQCCVFEVTLEWRFASGGGRKRHEQQNEPSMMALHCYLLNNQLGRPAVV